LGKKFHNRKLGKKEVQGTARPRLGHDGASASRGPDDRVVGISAPVCPGRGDKWLSEWKVAR
jgi:hypothetical protein